jgi:hypothetical protein
MSEPSILCLASSAHLGAHPSGGSTRAVLLLRGAASPEGTLLRVLREARGLHAACACHCQGSAQRSSAVLMPPNCKQERRPRHEPRAQVTKVLFDCCLRPAVGVGRRRDLLHSPAFQAKHKDHEGALQSALLLALKRNGFDEVQMLLDYGVRLDMLDVKQVLLLAFVFVSRCFFSLLVSSFVHVGLLC